MIYTVAEVVQDKMIEEGRSTLHKFEALLPLAVRAARDLQLSVGGNIKTVYLTPTTYNTISVPEDYYSYSKIGVCIQGIIYNIQRNPDMCFPHMTNACGQLQPENYGSYGSWADYQAQAVGLDTGWVYWAYTAYNEFGEFVGRMYGNGSGFGVGVCNYNPQTREFVLSPNLQAQSIVLEYVSTGINNANIPVPEEAIESMISFVNWKAAKGAERKQFEMEYKNNVTQMRINKYSFTLDDFIFAIRQGYSLSPKG